MADKNIEKIHFIGVGGVGMSGIAHVAADQGLRVSGSDLRKNGYTDQLAQAGVDVRIGQVAENIATGEDEPDVVVVSTAILENNQELQEARSRHLEIWHRAKMLAYLGRGLKTLAVAGTHGKTTTSSMLASAMDALGADPTFLIGGIVRAYGTNAHSGTGEYYVVEADESDKSFMHLNPAAVLITNIEADHLDHYRDLDEIYEKFKAFIASVPRDGGVAVVCGDDVALANLARECGCTLVTYGFNEGNDVRIVDAAPRGIGSTFTLSLPGGRQVTGSIKQNPGVHNVLNGAGVIALLDALGYDPQVAAEALSEFAGVRRRFDLVGNVRGITVVDDYAHHPTEIAATIKAAKELDFDRVIVLFQPHRYSRVKLFTEVLKEEFARAFNDADVIVFMDVFAAGEAPVPGISGKTFLNTVLDNPEHPEAYYIGKRIEVVPFLKNLLQEGDIIFTMGAGDITAIGPQLVDELVNGEAK